MTSADSGALWTHAAASVFDVTRNARILRARSNRS